MTTGCARKAETPPASASHHPNILLVTLDTCRPDFIACYRDEGYADTPHMDRLAAEGVLFERAGTSIPSTLPSHASILTGLKPLRHGIHDNGVYRLADGFTTMTEVLKEGGYRTGAFLSAYVLDHRFGLEQGFDVYDDAMEDPLQTGAHPGFPFGVDARAAEWVSRRFAPYQRRGDRTAEAAITWMRSPSDAPFFAWVHLFDPHAPYAPPDSFVTRYDPGYRGAMTGDAELYYAAARAGTVREADYDHMVARYRGEIGWTDACVGMLRDALESAGLLENTLIVVIGDHGEGLGEHGIFFEHNTVLYREVIRVPFIMRFPRRMDREAPPAGWRVRHMVRTTDMMPTVLQFAGLPLPDGMDGRSLVPCLADHGDQEAVCTSGSGTGEMESAIYLEALCNEQALPSPIERRGLRTHRWKFIRTTARVSGHQTYELYDRDVDPGEEHNVASRYPEVVRELDERLDARIAGAVSGEHRPESSLPLDEATREKLRSLGYIR